MPAEGARAIGSLVRRCQAEFAAGKDTSRLARALSRPRREIRTGCRCVCLHDTAVARAAADRSTERWRAGRPLSLIDGMPLGIKDVIETADMPTEQGSPLFVGCRTERDAVPPQAVGATDERPV